MIVGCYTMDLYCDNADRKSEGFRKTCTEGWERSQYIGMSYSGCMRSAKKEGWRFRDGRFSYCPKCSAKKSKVQS